MLEGLRIAVIGAGAATVCLLDSLSRRENVPESLTVFESGSYLWRGRAYRSDSGSLRVNTLPHDLSVRPDSGGHFQGWLREQSGFLDLHPEYIDSYNDVPFVPRFVFGDYLEDCAERALHRLEARGCAVEILAEGVSGLTSSAEAKNAPLLIHTETGTARQADRVVLCVGSGSPMDHYGLMDAPGFIPDPYPVMDTLSEIDPTADIAVLGSGLTAVDVVLTLARSGHRGRILLASRTGVLPAVRQRPIQHTLRYFTPEHFQGLAVSGKPLTLSEAVALMGRELESAGADTTAASREITLTETENPAARLRRQLAAVDAHDVGLRLLQQAVPECGPDVWVLLPDADKDQVLELRRTFMSLCCPMPPDSARALLDLIGTGQLHLSRNFKGIVPDVEGGFVASTTEGEVRVKVVVNAVPPAAHGIPPRAASLISSLTSAGAARPHPRGGLHIERSTSRLIGEEGVHTQLYALGDLAAGSLFVTFGLPSLVDRAEDIANSILGSALAAMEEDVVAMQPS